jgi:hypothetical protein
MANPTMERFRSAAESLRRHLNNEKFRIHQPERAFIEWYLLARFGRPDQVNVTDGARDGGIDAVVEHRGKIFVIQSKYETSPRISQLNRSDLAAFERTITNLQNEDDDVFNKWLNTCREGLHTEYKQLRRRVLTNNGDVRFILITTKRLADIEPGQLLELEDIQQIVSLWELYQDGFTPPTEAIRLTLKNAWHTTSEDGVFKTYVGLADVEDFLRLMDEDKNERLFAQNVRTDLRSQINKGIRATYENASDSFWLGNNGIYIVCKKVVPNGDVYELVYPSIINGSQTLHSVYSSNRRHSCKIMVRILQMDVHGNQELLSKIIRRTNTQNPMKLVNLCAHDPFQLNIARYLDRYKIFYERREKEWQNEKKQHLTEYDTVNIKDVAQWLSTLNADIGFGRARSRVSELFDGYYQQIFGAFDMGLNSPKYLSLTEIVWAGLVSHSFVYYLSKNKRPFAKMSHLLLTKLVYESVRDDQRLHNVADDLLRKHRYGWKELPKPLIDELRKVIFEFVSIQKKNQRRDPNTDFSNFFKKDDLCKEAYKSACAPKIPKIARVLVRHASEIY